MFHWLKNYPCVSEVYVYIYGIKYFSFFFFFKEFLERNGRFQYTQCTRRHTFIIYQCELAERITIFIVTTCFRWFEN